jgi:hypothetical protein
VAHALRYLFVALPRPAPRRVFRPARRVSWGTRIFAFIVLIAAIGAIGGFLEIFLPQQVALVAKSEANELQQARLGTSDVNTSLNRLWGDLSKSSVGLSNDQLATDLALAKQTETNASTALGHVQAAQAYLAQAEGMPFQFHTPSFVTSDGPLLDHLTKALNTASKLAHGATLQISFAQSMNQNLVSLNDLYNSLNAHDWAGGARTAATLGPAIKLQQGPVSNPDALLDPLWSKWVDATLTIVLDAQQYCLAAAQNQSQLAQQDAALVASARAQQAAAFSAAQGGAAAWQAKTIQPLLDSANHEAAAAGS